MAVDAGRCGWAVDELVARTQASKHRAAQQEQRWRRDSIEYTLSRGADAGACDAELSAILSDEEVGEYTSRGFLVCTRASPEPPLDTSPVPTPVPSNFFDARSLIAWCNLDEVQQAREAGHGWRCG